MSAEIRHFLARLAIDPDAYCRYLDDPRAAVRDAGLSDADWELLASGDQHRIYLGLTSDSTDAEQS